MSVSALLSAYSVILRLASAFLIAEGIAQLKWRWFNKSSAPLQDLVLHDSATRGPLGCVQLLWRFPWPGTWQWIGCVIAIGSLATGPVTQLALQYETCPVNVTGGFASIPRAQVLFDRPGTSGQTLSPAEAKALNLGVTSFKSIAVTCSSGNCSFPAYKSIGYCSDCDDLSSKMLFATTGTGLGSDGKHSNFYSYLPNDTAIRNAQPGFMGIESTIYEPGGISGSSEVANALPPGGYDTYNTLNIMIGPPNQENGTLLDCSNNRTWACQGYAAVSCRMFPCVREYNSSVTNGILQETVVNQWNDSIFGSFGKGVYWGDARAVISTIYKPCLNFQQISQLRVLGYNLDANEHWLEYNGSWTQHKNATHAALEQDLLNSGCFFAMDPAIDSRLGFYFSDNGPFNGSVIGKQNPLGGKTWKPFYFTGPPLLLAVHNAGDMSFERTRDIFKNMSLSLTNYMRLNVADYTHSDQAIPGLDPDQQSEPLLSLNNTSTPVEGTVEITKTCLQVRWGWLAFPTAVAVMTLLFFTGVLLSSANLTRDVRTWKSSLLPFLFFGLPGTTVTSQHLTNLEEVAKSISVKLVLDEEGNMVLRKENISG